MNKKEIRYFKADDKGKGLPFALVSHAELMGSDDLFTPSLRDFHVIFWFKKGSGTYYVDFEAFTFQPNTIVLISKDQLHYIVPPEEDWEVQSIVFKSDFVYRTDVDLQHLFNFGIQCHNLGEQILTPDANTVQALELFSAQMKQVFETWQEPHRSNAFYHWLCLFLIQCETLQPASVQQEKSTISEDDKMINAFTSLLETHFASEFKVDFYLDQLGLTNKSLSRLTKKRFHLSPKAVINERRLLEIKRLLRGTTKPVKEIGYALHFDEPTNLVKYFKKGTGMTPNAFRSGA